MNPKIYYRSIRLHSDLDFFYLVLPGDLDRFDVDADLDKAIAITEDKLEPHRFGSDVLPALACDVTDFYNQYDDATLFLIAKKKSDASLVKITPIALHFPREEPQPVSAPTVSAPLVVTIDASFAATDETYQIMSRDQISIPIHLAGSLKDVASVALYQVVANKRTLMQLLPLDRPQRDVVLVWKPTAVVGSSGQIVVEVLSRGDVVLASVSRDFSYERRFHLFVDEQELRVDREEVTLAYQSFADSDVAFIRVDFLSSDGSFTSSAMTYPVGDGAVTFSRSALVDYTSVRLVPCVDATHPLYDSAIELPLVFVPFLLSVTPDDGSNILFVGSPSRWSVDFFGDPFAVQHVLWGYEISGHFIDLDDVVAQDVAGIVVDLVLGGEALAANRLVARLHTLDGIVDELSFPITVLRHPADIAVTIEGPAVVACNTDVSYAVDTTALYDVYYAVSSSTFDELVASKFAVADAVGPVQVSSPVSFRLHDEGRYTLYVYVRYAGQYFMIARQILTAVDELPIYHLVSEDAVAAGEELSVHLLVKSGPAPAFVTWSYVDASGEVAALPEDAAVAGDLVAVYQFADSLTGQQVTLRAEAYHVSGAFLGSAVGAVTVGAAPVADLVVHNFPASLAVDESVVFSVSSSRPLVENLVSVDIYDVASRTSDFSFPQNLTVGADFLYTPHVPGRKELLVRGQDSLGEKVFTRLLFSVSPIAVTLPELVVAGKPYASLLDEIYLYVTGVPKNVARVEWWTTDSEHFVEKVGEGLELHYKPSDELVLSFIARGFDSSGAELALSLPFDVRLSTSPAPILDAAHLLDEEKVLFLKLRRLLKRYTDGVALTDEQHRAVDTVLLQISSVESAVVEAFEHLSSFVDLSVMYGLDLDSLLTPRFKTLMDSFVHVFSMAKYGLALKTIQNFTGSTDKDATSLYYLRHEFLDRYAMQLQKPDDWLDVTDERLPELSLEEDTVEVGEGERSFSELEDVDTEEVETL